MFGKGFSYLVTVIFLLVLIKVFSSLQVRNDAALSGMAG